MENNNNKNYTQQQQQQRDEQIGLPSHIQITVWKGLPLPPEFEVVSSYTSQHF